MPNTVGIITEPKFMCPIHKSFEGRPLPGATDLI